jgi:hypothetical protein
VPAGVPASRPAEPGPAAYRSGPPAGLPQPPGTPQGITPGLATQPGKLPKPGKPKRGRIPTVLLVYLGLALMLVSPVAAAIPIVKTVGTVSELAGQSTSVPVTNEVILFDLKAGDYTIWSSNGRWEGDCTLARGRNQIRLSRAADVPLPSSLLDALAAQPVRDFTTKTGEHQFTCATDSPSATVYYIIPAVDKGWISWPVIGLAITAALLLAGLVLLVTQEIRRSVWLRRRTGQF